MFLDMEKILRGTACLACACVLGLIGIALATGVGQDPLQFVHPPDAYTRILLDNPPALRACLALDNFFVVFYATMYVALGVLLMRHGAARGLVAAALAFLFALAILDLVENFHFMVMLARAELGEMSSAREIALQVNESLLKFHVGYLGLFLLGLALPRATLRQRVLANLSVFVQLPVGILIYVAPSAIAVPLVFVRLAYFVTALILVSGLFRATSASPAAAAGSGALASPPDTRLGVAG
jgi:hypothetical protein